MSEAKHKIQEEAKLEAAAEAALQDAVHALEDARAEMKVCVHVFIHYKL